MDRIEEWKRTTHAELFGEYGKPGLIQEMRTFFAVQQSRDKSLPLKVGVLAIIIPLGYDIIKHMAGWK
jgi:hypothetical protein